MKDMGYESPISAWIRKRSIGHAFWLLVVAIGGLHLAMPFRAMSSVSMGAIEIRYNAPSDAIPDQSQSTL
jgi:hypothetical protein